MERNANNGRNNQYPIYLVGGPQNAKRVFRKASVGTIGVDARIVYFENRDGEWVEIAAKDIPPYQPMPEAARTSHEGRKSHEYRNQD